MTPALFDMIMRLRGKGISDNNVLRAMETVPRAAFVASAHIDLAYEDKSLPIGCGQSLSPPWIIAAMSQAAEVSSDHKVLEIGTGSGYHAACLATLCRRVYSVERYQSLAEEAEQAMRRVGVHNVVVRHCDGLKGWRGQAPFDRIIVTTGLSAPPGTLFGQLAPYGRLIAVVDDYMTVYEKDGMDMKSEKICPASLPMCEAGVSKAI